MTILDALDDENLLGAAFPEPGTWAAWRVFLAAVFGLPMSDEQAAVYAKHTGRTTPPTAQAKEAWAICGRRAGKSRIAAVVATFLACFRTYRLAPGESGVLMVIACD